MTLQNSGPISLANIQTEFTGGTNPIGFDEYYRGAPNNYVSLHAKNTISTAGSISLDQFYGASIAMSPGENVQYGYNGTNDVTSGGSAYGVGAGQVQVARVSVPRVGGVRFKCRLSKAGSPIYRSMYVYVYVNNIQYAWADTGSWDTLTVFPVIDITNLNVGDVIRITGAVGNQAQAAYISGSVDCVSFSTIETVPLTFPNV